MDGSVSSFESAPLEKTLLWSPRMSQFREISRVAIETSPSYRWVVMRACEASCSERICAWPASDDSGKSIPALWQRERYIHTTRGRLRIFTASGGDHDVLLSIDHVGCRCRHRCVWENGFPE